MRNPKGTAARAVPVAMALVIGTWLVSSSSGGARGVLGLAGAMSSVGLPAIASQATPLPTPTDGTSSPTPDPTPASALRVQRNELVNALGQPLTLRGVNRADPAYPCVQGWGIFEGPSDTASIAALRSWRVNAVRLPLNEHCWLGINGVAPMYSGTLYQQAVVDYVSLLNANGLYAIVDLHWSAPATALATGQQPMPDLDHAVAFWSSVAAAFKGNDAVILDLFNEPWPDDQRDSAAAWTCWRDGGTCPGVPFQAAGMQTLVDVVRGTGATNVIALGGVSYSNALSQWLAYKPSDPLNGLVASWHVYDFNICSTIACFGNTVAAVAARVPLVATEIATDTCDAVFFADLMGWLDAHQSGYLAWTWNTWGDACAAKSLIRDYAGTPTTYGQLYRDHLATLLPCTSARGDPAAGSDRAGPYRLADRVCRNARRSERLDHALFETHPAGPT